MPDWVWKGLTGMSAMAGILMYLETSKWLPMYIDLKLLALIAWLSLLTLISVMISRFNRVSRLEREWEAFLKKKAQDVDHLFGERFKCMARDTDAIREGNSATIQQFQDRLKTLEDAFGKQGSNPDPPNH